MKAPLLHGHGAVLVQLVAEVSGVGHVRQGLAAQQQRGRLLQVRPPSHYKHSFALALSRVWICSPTLAAKAVQASSMACMEPL